MSAILDRNEEARVCDAKISEAEHNRKKYSMIIGWYGHRLKARNLFGELGYESEDAYVGSRELARSTWYRMVRLGMEFSQLALDEFLTMTVENAEALADVQPEHRYNQELLEAAATQKNAVFLRTLAEFGAVLAGRPPSDARSPMSFHLTKSQTIAIRSGLKEWMTAHQITDEGEALEMLVAEYSDRDTLIGTYHDTIDLLRQAAFAGDYVTVADAQDQMLVLAGKMQKEMSKVVQNREHMQLVA